MASIQHIYVYSFLVAIIAGQVFLFMQGWQPKESNEQNPDPFEDDKGQGNHVNEPIVSKQIPAGRKGRLQDASPLPSHDISEAKEYFPTVSTIGQKTGNEFDSSQAAYAKGYQPTTPGNSPRVGHSHVGREDENEQNAHPMLLILLIQTPMNSDPQHQLTALVLAIPTKAQTGNQMLRQCWLHINLFELSTLSMAPKCSILATLFVVLIVSQNLQIIEDEEYSPNSINGSSATRSSFNAARAIPGATGFGSGAPGHADKFRPTAPGHSPGWEFHTELRKEIENSESVGILNAEFRREDFLNSKFGREEFEGKEGIKKERSVVPCLGLQQRKKTEDLDGCDIPLHRSLYISQKLSKLPPKNGMKKKEMKR
ncbi:hypothetical protein ACH5RR_014078 [Cinchona calisaya]|uniref:Uncharacterized protein n=1 Tax=Cinchona calisaya TaxID=153742 RepID=A0ABD3A1V6_9GENT